MIPSFIVSSTRRMSLMFFTGFHDDYHRPTDDWERIDARGATEIGRIALEAVAELAK